MSTSAPDRPLRAFPLTQPLNVYVTQARREASDADWLGNTERARFLERLATSAIERGEDPVILF